jgi:hypothetical protein
LSLQGEYKFRSELVDALTRDLLGPSSETEEIPDAPITRYICGILYPQEDPTKEPAAESLVIGAIDPDQDVDEPDDYDDTSLPDPPVAMANVKYPSSVGLTFAVDSRYTDTIRIQTAAARYERGDGGAWRRVPVAGGSTEIDIRLAGTGNPEVAPGLELYWRVRSPTGNGVVAVTVALINTLKKAGADRDAFSFFQPAITVDAPTARRLVFSDRAHLVSNGSDEDLNLYRLLYRGSSVYAVGHGCSVDWDTGVDATSGRIWTTIVPRVPVAVSESNPEIQLECLDTHFLASAAPAQLVAALQRLPGGYEVWIRLRESEVGSLPPELQEAAKVNVARCRDALTRIGLGISVLEHDAAALRAFQLANAAMQEQRARSQWFAAGRPTPAPDTAKGFSWRPFQLAFILLCLRGIAEPDSDDRNIGDLLWFPTGGGKTEAYLGLVAFVVFLRRLRRARAGGVTALMRYTLRLLTIQQFERASILICACEAQRRLHKDLGDAPISVGLWVGQDATPNDLKAARVSLDKLRTNPALEKSNPVQLHACPSCGTPLDHRNYYIAADGSRLVIDCRNKTCEFVGGLPIYVVDEDIYRYRPTLLIATADKFASLPWREQAAKLFNLQSGDPPPELIIQDELHLISGPLGTLAGLYETAIDLMSSSGEVRPKLVASTATIRRAGDQARALFDRAVRQFPPPGLDAGDSYFAREAPEDKKGNRLYVGLMAPGTSQTTLLVRTYAALLQRTLDIAGEDAVKDPYWTLIGYFNSLRVLGGARMQVQDDVDDRMTLLSPDAKRTIENRIELTSRESSGEIPQHLKRMAVGLPSTDTLDVILATNMISVGVDVDRLGLMVVMGQPQSTSEYIQATSRVGRQHAGLVVTLFNAARSRDRSHYEAFAGYHSALYRQVESTSVTPYSPRARDRALHAVVVALARLMIPQLRADNAAADVGQHLPELEAVKQKILDRVLRVAPTDVDATAAQIDTLLADWIARAKTVPGLVYGNRRKPELSLLIDASEDESDTDALRTLWSLRDVDKSSNLYLVT